MLNYPHPLQQSSNKKNGIESNDDRRSRANNGKQPVINATLRGDIYWPAGRSQQILLPPPLRMYKFHWKKKIYMLEKMVQNKSIRKTKL